MTPKASFRKQSGTAAQIYEQSFVPSVARPASGQLFELAELRPGQRVLDLACGTGVAARRAAEEVGSTGSVVGVDLSPEMLAVARTIPAPDGVEIEWEEADAGSLPLPAGSVDVTLCHMGMMFFADKAAALAEVRRVLVSDGRFALSTPGAIQAPFELLDRALVEHINPDLGGFVRAVFSLHDPDVVTSLLGEAGFVDIDGITRTIPLQLPRPAEFLWQYIASTPLGVFVGNAPDDAQAALEKEIVETWQPFVDDDGHLAIDQPMVYARGTSR